MPNPTRLRVEPLEDRVTPAAAGELDPAFGAGGLVTYSQPDIIAVAAAPDGDTFVALTDGVRRLNPDGTADAQFGTGGFVAASSLRNLTALPGGGVLLLGDSGNTFVVTRLTPLGVPDPTFGTAGTATVAVGDGTAVQAAAALTPDGRVVVVGGMRRGSTLDGAAVTVGEMVAVRLTAAGQPDASFGDGGRVAVAVPVNAFTHAGASAVSVGPDGRVVLAGFAVQSGYKTNGPRPPFSLFWVGTAAPAAVRLFPDGQLDPTFGTGGRVVLPVRSDGPLDGGFEAVQVLDDSRVLLAGVGTLADRPQGASEALAVRLTAAGQPDPTYGFGGRAVSTAINPVVTIDAQHRVLFGTARLTADGAADPAFGANGIAAPALAPGADTVVVREVVPQANGDILIGLTFRQTSSDPSSSRVVRLVGVSPPAGFTPGGAGTVVVGGPANGTVQVLTPTGSALAAAGGSVYLPGVGQNYRPGSVEAFVPVLGQPTGSPQVQQTVRAARADVTGDGTPDYVLAAGPGGPPRVVVLDGATGRVAADFAPFESTFTGGAFAAAADLDLDGRAELIVTPDQGGGGRVVVYSVAAGGTPTLRASFFGIDDANFRGGARIAAGDVNRDGVPDVVVAAGFGGGPRVAVFGGGSVIGGAPARLTNDFFAFPGTDAVNLRNGTFVAAGDVDGDGFADLIFGGGPGGAPRVFILSGSLVSAGQVDAAQAGPVANFFVAGNANDRGGARVAAVNADGDARADVAVGSGEGSPANVRVYLGANVGGGGEPGVFQDITVFGGAALPGGVFVG